MPLKHCSVCGAAFTCGIENERGTCWCSDYPPIMPLDFSQDCRCPDCLKMIVQEKIAEYLQTITPATAHASDAPNYGTAGRLIEGIDYYLDEQGRFVLTAWYLLKRGHCCRNGCTHCPYGCRVVSPDA